MTNKDEILKKVDMLINMYKNGELGGEVMPEDANPHFEKSSEDLNRSDVQLIVIDRWNELFKGTKYKPIDIHTPLWLWSRNGFKEVK